MRHRMLAVSAVLGILLLAGCRASAVPGSAYASAGATARSSTAPSAASPASPVEGTAPASASPAMLTVRKTPAGVVLADASGYTIYWFARDHRGSPRSACTSRCLLASLPVAGHPVPARPMETARPAYGTSSRRRGPRAQRSAAPGRRGLRAATTQ